MIKQNKLYTIKTFRFRMLLNLNMIKLFLPLLKVLKSFRMLLNLNMIKQARTEIENAMRFRMLLNLNMIKQI